MLKTQCKRLGVTGIDEDAVAQVQTTLRRLILRAFVGRSQLD